MGSGSVDAMGSASKLTKVQFLKENPNYGFNSTTQRFSYLQELQRLGQTPGPGAYDIDKGHSS